MKREVDWTPDRKLFRELYESSQVLAWITDPDGYCVYLTPAWYSYTGMEHNAALGFGWLEAIHPDDRTRTRNVYFSAVDRQAPYNVGYQLVRADGKYRPAVASGSPRFRDKDFLGFIGTTLTVEEFTRTSEQPYVPDRDVTPVLTPREREVLQLIARGNTSDTVGAMLHISPKTVDAHVKTATTKLDASNRLSAIVKAAKRKEIDL